MLATTAGLYWHVLFNDFINYDDTAYVTNNPYIRSGLTLKGIVWAFSTTYICNWHPLTWVSHMLDIQLFGLNPVGHHLVNVLFHLANTFLLFTFLRITTGAIWRSYCVALLFALHPLHVESVAWIAERKGLLSSFFWLLTILAYVAYTRNPKLSRYLPLVGFFFLGLLSKPMIITIPFVLLLLDYWPLGRLRIHAPAVGPTVSISQFTPLLRLVMEKLPLFALALASGIITYSAQKSGGAVNLLTPSSFWQNVANAFLAYMSYIGKMLWPTGLAVFYPFDASAIIPWTVISAVLCLLIISYLAIWGGMERKYLITGWLWYTGSLVPVIGLVRVGSQSMADRYTYIPLIGLFIIVVWGTTDLLENWRYKKQALFISAGSIIIAITVVTWIQIQFWRNPQTLFSHALKVTKNNWIAHYNLGSALLKQGKDKEALAHLLETVRINPGFFEAYNNIGIAYENFGNNFDAIKAYKIAIRSNPNFADAHFNLGLAYFKLGYHDLAMAEYRILQRISKDDALEFLRMISADVP